MDSWIADSVPCRDAALLANARIQRFPIEIAAKSFGYKAFPSFFGSDYCVVPEDRMVVKHAQRAPVKDEDSKVGAWVRTLNNVAKENPDIRIVYECVARHDQSQYNPTYELMSGELVNPQWVENHLFSKLDNRIESFIDAVSSQDEIRNEWFSTEEHWKFARAVKSYNLLAERLNLKEYTPQNIEIVASDWYGDYSRMALDLDFAIDLEDDLTRFDCLSAYGLMDFGGKKKAIGMREKVLDGEYEFTPGGYHYYTSYYGGGSIEIANEGQNNGKVALIVSDSP